MASTLDIEDPRALREYLVATGRIGAADDVTTRVLPGGVSCRTVFVRQRDGVEWVLKQALAKLRVQGDWFSNPERVHREAAALRRLGQLAPVGTVPAFVFEDFESHTIAMSAVPEPHENWKTILLTRGPEHDHARQFGQLLGTIHRQAAENFTTLASEFGDITYFDELRIDAYYRSGMAKVPAAAEFLTALIADTYANRMTLVHGDFSPKNVLVYRGQFVLLDYEVVHWGDPAFDVGFGLTHLLAKARHFPARQSAFIQAALEFWGAYQAETKNLFPQLESRAVRHTLACLLARVAGKSPLEYLDANERAALQADLPKLIAASLCSVETLVRFTVPQST
ncbi:MAG: hypothetical protein JWM32_2674 [Verrucomicrobia bacterium]|nr:hypothetical protein [Verrucomicrobiota bacterium]